MAHIDAEQKARKELEDGLKNGAFIQMHHPGKGFRFVENTEKAIGWALKRGYSHVEYDEEVVRKPRVRVAEPKAEAAPAPKRGPGRPRKVENKDGE